MRWSRLLLHLAVLRRAAIALTAISVLSPAAARPTGIATDIRARETSAIEISYPRIDAPTIRVAYPIISNCASLPFIDQRENVTRELRSTWKRDKASCGRLDASGVSFDGCTGSQRHVVFHVPVRAISLDRVYPPATPVLGEGVLIHTGTFATTASCGEHSMILRAPMGGAIALPGGHRQKNRSAVLKSGSLTSPTYFFIGRAGSVSREKIVFANSVEPSLRS